MRRKRQSAVEVVLVVVERLLDRLANGFQGCKVNDTVDGVRLENLFHGSRFKKIHMVKSNLLAGNILDPTKALLGRIAQIVNNNYVVIKIQQLNAGVGTNETRSTSDQNGFLASSHSLSSRHLH